MTAALTINDFDRLRAWDSVLIVWSRFLAMTTLPDSVENVVRAESQDVTAAQGGDSDAFGRLVDTHQAMIGQQMRRFSRDAAVVEELVHDVFVEAYMSLKTFRGQSPLIHWLRKLAVRVGYRYWQRQTRDENRTVPLSEVDAILEPSDGEPGICASQANETLHELLHLLSPRDRLVLTSIYWDDCTVAEAAELAGWTKTMTKVQAHRARKRLKHLIEESKR